MGLKSYVFAGGKKFGREWMTGQRVFVAMLDALRMTPVREWDYRLIVEDVSSAAKFHNMICCQPLKKMKIAEKACFHRLKPVGKTALRCGNVALLFFCKLPHSQS
ncbi:hypothetical protein [Sanguibacter keddieii]|uniref:hypothetical protein n=1 Tax=Sanguibacter keddieii TaxID=60920 RepID=UPI00128AE43C|nr:hypothetical protein [Sanguibacter keddieii]